MAEVKQPTTWQVIRRSDDDTRGWLQLDCGQSCTIPLWTFEAKGKRWHWNGNVECPSVSPSIACEKCGWHKTITDGKAT